MKTVRKKDDYYSYAKYERDSSRYFIIHSGIKQYFENNNLAWPKEVKHLFRHSLISNIDPLRAVLHKNKINNFFIYDEQDCLDLLVMIENIDKLRQQLS